MPVALPGEIDAPPKVLFASHAVGAIVLPIMVFHQMQLMVCAVLAQRYAQRSA